MSEKKSWDIQPSAPKSVHARPQAETARETPRRARGHTVPTRREAVRRTSLPRKNTPLKERRRGKRKTVLKVFCILLFLFCGGVLALLWQPFVRVTTISAEGPGSAEIPAFVSTQLQGTRYGILPKNSIFFLPQIELRTELLKAFPSVQALSLTPTGLSSLTVKTVGRATSFWWCGPTLAEKGDCYQTDPEGKIFMMVGLEGIVASTSVLSVYGTLAPTDLATTSVLGRTLISPQQLPALLQFVKAMKTLGADVTSVAIRGDEADLYTQAGTRITYVLGREEQAATLASTSFPSLHLNDGSLLYIDLRFDSKIFFKKKTEVQSK